MWTKIDRYGRDCGPYSSVSGKIKENNYLCIDQNGNVYVHQPCSFRKDNDKVLEVFVMGKQISIRYIDNGKIKYVSCPGVTYEYEYDMYGEFPRRIKDMDVYY